MSLLDRVKTRAAPDLPDAEIQAMIDAILAEIDARFGPVGPVTRQLLDERSLRTMLHLSPPASPASAVMVTEIDLGSNHATGRLNLQPDDFILLHSGRTLLRSIAGPNPREFWGFLVEVTYTPQGPTQAQRDASVVKLATLDLSVRGALRSEKAGDYQFTLSNDPAADRAAILDSLTPPSSGMMMA